MYVDHGALCASNTEYDWIQKLTMNDYLAIFRRRLAVIIIVAAVSALAGYLISYAFPAERSSPSAASAGRTATDGNGQVAARIAELAEAKRTLDDRASKLEAFKQVHGLTPQGDNHTDAQRVLKSRLSASRWLEDRARQDKAYAQSLLAQQLAGRAGDARLSAASEKSATESVAVRQLRLQIRQYDDQIAGAARDQKRLQEQLDSERNRGQLDADAAEQYRRLNQDYETAEKSYSVLLARSSTSEPQAAGDQQESSADSTNSTSSQGTPDSTNRSLWFAGAGLAGGLAASIGLVVWLGLRGKTLRTPRDVQAALQAPVLVSVPWVGSREGANIGKNPPVEVNPAISDKPEKATIEV
jgi:hypothetical protein